MRFEQYDYRIPECFMSALINGDTSGLEQPDIDEFARFEKQIEEQHTGKSYHWSYTEEAIENPYFTWSADITPLGATVVDCQLMVAQ